MRRHLLCLALGLLLSAPALWAQIDEAYVRDSVEIERGLAGTADFEPFFRMVNEAFDANNRPLRSVVYEYVSETELIPNQRQSFQYDDDGNTTFFLLEEWDQDAEDWTPIKQESSNYEDGRLAMMLRQVAVDGELQNRRRWAYQYNAAGKETEKLLQGWNANDNSWTNLSRKTTTYNAEGNITEQLLERSQDGTWVNSRRRTWTWEMGELQPTETIGQIWSEAEGSWINESRKTYAMGANGLWSGSIVEVWDATNGEWINDVREAFMVDLNNNATTYTIQRWNGEWVSDYRSQYGYSAEQTTATLQRWNATDMAHENFLQSQSMFNANRLPTRQMGMQVWNAEQGAWLNENFPRRISYFWREAGPNSTNEVSAEQQCLIPNPYFSNTPINCDRLTEHFPVNLEIYSLYGQLLLRKEVNSPSFQLATHDLPSGMYVFMIAAGNQLLDVQKVVIAQ